ncbi:peptidoglycan DD-metalloendopeptidase family protein [Azospirillum sp. RWY-5-1]|uniref:Peptidoglycan DD-metalloendopeptidase family protein n=1 Tax=Azospirillum oleiclasticum TaxID=2735135 RepID=A0ABX2TC90_9PROT|nr:peptidoglycan DD-metalloendopeptidase family protein [Azospirillum oleiclasticum]NYZ13603.1 peptidoglycan DD-metalloendopeptidase family protein [Azospirillum oleiclasticum]NYZ20763.1 peptidoglycan DD-metalloendopeptidase family protein [Azospirillum oleiclasticum]
MAAPPFAPASADPRGGTRRRDNHALILPLAAALCLGALGASAQEAPRQSLKRVEEEMQADRARQRALDRQSQTVRREIEDLRTRLVDLADRARAQETELDRIESGLAELENRERGQAARLDAERQQIAALLAALQRLSRVPPEAVIARPEGPVDTLRSALMLRETVPALRERADSLAAGIAALATTRESLRGQRVAALAARHALDERQAELARLVERREELSRQTDEERGAVGQRMAKLGAQAADLRQLMERIEQERRAAMESASRREAERLEAERRLTEQREAERRLAEQKLAEQKAAEQKLAEQKAAERRAEVAVVQRPPDAPADPSGAGVRLPAGGKVTLRYGETDRYGALSRGLTIASRPGSPVVSPFSGSIMFAGPFRGYGLILIVEHAGGYHSLIAGLGRIDTTVGKHVAAGEPIGLMPSPSDGNPDLYYELRRHGQPINPQRGLGAPEGKGQG